MKHLSCLLVTSTPFRISNGRTKALFYHNKPFGFICLTIILTACQVGKVAAATAIVGAVAINSSTGQYYSNDGNLVTTGLIKVGFFRQSSFYDIQSVINNWSSSTTAFEKYNSLNSLFTPIGTEISPPTSGGTYGGSTTGLYSTPDAGWNFSSTGRIAGTASYIDLALVPQGSQIYQWAFNNFDFTFDSADAPTEWALVTNRDPLGFPAWTMPGMGVLIMVLNRVSPQDDILLGSDNGNNVNMTPISAINVPEPSSLSLLALGGVVVALGRRRK
jgi:hypothetical protein